MSEAVRENLEELTVGELRERLADAGVPYSTQEFLKQFRYPGSSEEERKSMGRQIPLSKSELVSALAETQQVAAAAAASLGDPDEDTPQAEPDHAEPGPDEPDPEDPEAAEHVERAHGQALELREEAVVQAPALLPSVAEFKAMREMAAAVAGTQMVPVAYRDKPDDVLAAILTGREMGLGPMQSLRDIFVIDGKPALAAHLLMAQMRKGGLVVLAKEVTDDRAWARVKRQDTGEESEVEWAYAEALEIETRERGRTIKLAEKTNWRNYRRDMLWARLVGRIARQVGPDLVGAAMPYSSEEVQDWEGAEIVGFTDEAVPFEGSTGREPTPERRGDPRQGQWIPPTNWTELSDRLKSQLGSDDAGSWLEELAEKVYGEASIGAVARGDDEDRARDLWEKLSGTLKLLEAPENGDLCFHPDKRKITQAAFHAKFEVAPLGPAWALTPEEAKSLPQRWQVLGLPEPQRPGGETTDEPSA